VFYTYQVSVYCIHDPREYYTAKTPILEQEKTLWNSKGRGGVAHVYRVRMYAV